MYRALWVNELGFSLGFDEPSLSEALFNDSSSLGRLPLNYHWLR